MSDERTPEQRKADDNLTDAIAQVTRVYGWGDGILTDYVVVSAHHNYRDDGEDLTTYGSLYRDGGYPVYRILGLLRAGTIQAEREFNKPDES